MNITWEPLPRRDKSDRFRKRPFGNLSKDQSLLRDLSGVHSRAGDRRSGPDQQVAADIKATIDARAEKHKASAESAVQHTTLQSKDGCAGEFYEYLDHTADVQCHTWGATIKEAFENMATCLLNYQTDITLIKIDPEETITMTVKGHDLESLLYNYMNELLFKFITDSFCAVKAEITEFDRDSFTVTATL